MKVGGGRGRFLGREGVGGGDEGVRGGGRGVLVVWAWWEMSSSVRVNNSCGDS